MVPLGKVLVALEPLSAHGSAQLRKLNIRAGAGVLDCRDGTLPIFRGVVGDGVTGVGAAGSEEIGALAMDGILLSGGCCCGEAGGAGAGVSAGGRSS